MFVHVQSRRVYIYTCRAIHVCAIDQPGTLPPPASTVPRGDPFARTVEMCFIAKFMFISFLPQCTAAGRPWGGVAGT